jgi:hypothetical protein
LLLMLLPCWSSFSMGQNTLLREWYKLHSSTASKQVAIGI